MKVWIEVKRCDDCPFHNATRTIGAGYALDYHCGATSDNKKIVGYVEWDSEIPKEPPKWCPFREGNERYEKSS